MRRRLGLSISVVIFFCCLAAGDSLMLKDGSRHSGTLVSASSRTISFREGTRAHRYSRSKVQAIEFGSSATASSGAEAATGQLRSSSGRTPVVLPAGTEISVLTNENIDSKTASEGQVF